MYALPPIQPSRPPQNEFLRPISPIIYTYTYAGLGSSNHNHTHSSYHLATISRASHDMTYLQPSQRDVQMLTSL
jgi:hypothetical protein